MQTGSEREETERGHREAQRSQPILTANFQRKIPKGILFHNNFVNHNAEGMGVLLFLTCEPKSAHKVRLSVAINMY